jgi:hypothetical protein
MAESDDMVIPVEVIAQASQAWRARMAESPADEDANSAVTGAYRAEYRVIARWAREVALREAEEAVRSERDRYLPGYPSRVPLGSTLRAIRALRSGTANTNPKGD